MQWQMPVVKRSLLLMILLIVFNGITYGQFSDSVHYYAGLSSSGTINKTNTSSSYISNQWLKLSVRKKAISLNTYTGWVYGKQQQKQTNNDFISTLDFNLYKSIPHAYYWGLATYTSSYSLKINNQYQAGAGVAYDVIDRKNLRLNLSDGILYEKSDLLLKDTIRDVYNTFRNSFRLLLRITLWDKVKLSSTTFYQNSLSSSTDYIFRTNNNLDIKLRKWLFVSCAYTYNRVNRTDKENTLFTYGLTVEHYF